MTITITEKEHWQRRIEAKINKRIEKLKSIDKTLFESIDEKAKQAAVAELGIEKEHSRYEKAGLQIRTLTKQREDLEAEMFTILFEDDSESHYYYKSRVNREIETRQKSHEEKLLSETEFGQEIANLQNEKENLLDTVWLATSPRQVTQLWEKLSHLIGEGSTEFQKEILAKPQNEQE